MATRKYGLIVSALDQRDRVFLAPAAHELVLPASVNLTPQMPPVYDQQNEGSCHDDQTEVLTSTGWKLFSEAMLTDRLATVNPATSALSFEFPTRIIRLPYAGMLHYGMHQHIDFAVTPNHKMLVRPWVESDKKIANEFKLIDMKDVGWYAGLMDSVKAIGEDLREVYILPGVPSKHMSQRVDKPIPMTSWLKFLGIYLAEGTMLKQKPSEMYKIQIAATKQREKEFVREVLAEMGQSSLELTDRFTISNQQLYTAMANLGLKSVKAAFKFVPEFVFQLPAEKIKCLLLGHWMGDGSARPGVTTHHTSSEQLAEDLSRLLLLSGSFSTTLRRPVKNTVMSDGREVRGKYQEKAINVWNGRGGLSIRRQKNVEQRYYEGVVYCAEVPTYHTLVTRRNGKVLISGNCTSQSVCAVLDMLYKQKHGDFLAPSRNFQYYNTRLLEKTTKSDAGGTIRDAIKAAAQYGVCPETEWPYLAANLFRKPVPKCYSDAKKEIVAQYQTVEQYLPTMKAALASGLPIVAGIGVYESFESETVATTGRVAMPAAHEKLLGGHAIVVVGYDDGSKTWLCRNSWGTSWGLPYNELDPKATDLRGHFRLPYNYLLNKQLTSDLWLLQGCA